MITSSRKIRALNYETKISANANPEKNNELSRNSQENGLRGIRSIQPKKMIDQLPQ